MSLHVGGESPGFEQQPPSSFAPPNKPSQSLQDFAVSSIRRNSKTPSQQLKWWRLNQSGTDVSRFWTNKNIVEDVKTGKIRLTKQNLHRLNREEAMALRQGISLSGIQKAVKDAMTDANVWDSTKAVLSLLLTDPEDIAVAYVENLNNTVFDEIHKGTSIGSITPETQEKINQFKQKLANMSVAERLTFMAKWPLPSEDHLIQGQLGWYTEAFGSDIVRELRIAKRLAGDHRITLTTDEIKQFKEQLETIRDPRACIEFMRTWKPDQKINWLNELKGDKQAQFCLALRLQGRDNRTDPLTDIEEKSLKACISSMAPKQKLEWMATWKCTQDSARGMLTDEKEFTTFRTAQRLQKISNDLRAGSPLRLEPGDFELFPQFLEGLTEKEKGKFLTQWEKDVKNTPLKNSGFLALFKLFEEAVPIIDRVRGFLKADKSSIAFAPREFYEMGLFLKSLDELGIETKMAILSQLPVNLSDSTDQKIVNTLLDGVSKELHMAKYLAGDNTIQITENDVQHLEKQLERLSSESQLNFIRSLGITQQSPIYEKFSAKTQNKIHVVDHLNKLRATFTQTGKVTLSDADKKLFLGFLRDFTPEAKKEFLATWQKEIEEDPSLRNSSFANLFATIQGQEADIQTQKEKEKQTVSNRLQALQSLEGHGLNNALTADDHALFLAYLRGLTSEERKDFFDSVEQYPALKQLLNDYEDAIAVKALEDRFSNQEQIHPGEIIRLREKLNSMNPIAKLAFLAKCETGSNNSSLHTILLKNFPDNVLHQFRKEFQDNLQADLRLAKYLAGIEQDSLQEGDIERLLEYTESVSPYEYLQILAGWKFDRNSVIGSKVIVTCFPPEFNDLP